MRIDANPNAVVIRKNPPKWEYCTLDTYERGGTKAFWWLDLLKALGEQGWEMAAATDRYIFFKRPL